MYLYTLVDRNFSTLVHMFALISRYLSTLDYDIILLPTSLIMFKFTAPVIYLPTYLGTSLLKWYS